MFIDIETTGLDRQRDSIIQLSFIYREDGKIRNEVDIREGDIYAQFLLELDMIVNRFDKNDKMYFLAYNADFDNHFIRRMFDENNNKFYGSYFYSPHICIMQLAAHKFMRKNKRPENFKLATVCKEFGIKVEEDKLHDGLYDVRITKELYNKLIKF